MPDLNIRPKRHNHLEFSCSGTEWLIPRIERVCLTTQTPSLSCITDGYKPWRVGGNGSFLAYRMHIIQRTLHPFPSLFHR